MKVALAIATTAAFSHWRFVALLEHKAPHAGRGFDYSALDGEVIAGQQLAYLRRVEHAGHEFGCNVVIKQPIPVLAEDGRISHWIVGRQAGEPAKQQSQVAPSIAAPNLPCRTPAAAVSATAAQEDSTAIFRGHRVYQRYATTPPMRHRQNRRPLAADDLPGSDPPDARS